MPPRKRRQPTSPRTTRKSKRVNASNSPQSQWSDIRPSAPPSNIPTPEGLQSHDYVISASPSPDLSTLAAAHETRVAAPQEDTSTDHADAIDALSASSPFMDWLEAQVGSYDEKRRLSEQLLMAESGLRKDNVTDWTEVGSVDAEGDASPGQGRAAKKREKGMKGDITNLDKSSVKPTDGEQEAPPHTPRPSSKDKNKSRKGKKLAKGRQPARSKIQLSAEDVKLVRALDRIGQSHSLTKGLLLLIAQQVPDARELIFETDQVTQQSRKDSMYNPDYFKRIPTVSEDVARAIVNQKSALTNIFNNAKLHDMPKSQPIEHPVGTDRPAHISSSVVDMHDRRMFNENIFRPPVQGADLPNDIITPSMTDMNNMKWQCGRCSHLNHPSKEEGSNMAIGSVQGVVQTHRCASCNESLIKDTEMLNAAQHAADEQMGREAELGENPRAVPIPGREPSRKTTTDVLAGATFRAA